MSTLHVRNVPQTLHERLRALARSDGRSMNAQVVTLLEKAVRESTPSLSVAEILAGARRIRGAATSRRRGPSSLTLLHEGRRQRRR